MIDHCWFDSICWKLHFAFKSTVDLRRNKKAAIQQCHNVFRCIWDHCNWHRSLKSRLSFQRKKISFLVPPYLNSTAIHLFALAKPYGRRQTLPRLLWGEIPLFLFAVNSNEMSARGIVLLRSSLGHQPQLPLGSISAGDTQRFYCEMKAQAGNKKI